MDMKEMILNGSAMLGAPLAEPQADALIRYYELLVERNKHVNLTRITDPEDVASKHFLDSLTAIATGRVKGRVADIGTGAGLPGLVLKCAAPEIKITLLDSLAKRVNFLKDAAAVMGITEGIEFLHSRAEDAGLDPARRESYDTVVSRAVANMRALSEWCLPLVRPGGYFLALKGPLAEEELADAKRAVKILGGSVEEVKSVSIPYTELDHKIVIIKKTRPTPRQFPRKGGKSTAVPIEKAYKTRN